MRVFMCRQNPYGDKVDNNVNVRDSYIEEFLMKKCMPIPYLHNLEVMKDIGIRPSMDKEQICQLLKTTCASSMDANTKIRKQKCGRIMRLLQIPNNVLMIVPWKKKWLIAKCSTQIRVTCVENMMFFYSKCQRTKTLFHTNSYDTLFATQKIEPCVALGFDIDSYVVIDKPKHIRLPPIALQELSSEEITKIISSHFK